MRYVNLGNCGLKVSEVCIGTWHLPRLGLKDAYGVPKVDVEETRKVLKVAFDRGVNFIDTANRYHGAMAPVDAQHWGNAERVLGEILKGYERESFVLATKVGGQMAPWPNGQGLSRKHIFWQMKESLRRLQMEYIDLYLIHTPDSETPHLETLVAFNDLVRMGKVHYIGSSNLSPDDIEDFMELSRQHELASFVALQEAYNLFERAIEREKVPLARRYNLAVMAYSPLAQGLLSGKYLSGVPQGSRATYYRDLTKALTEDKLKVVKELNEIAKEKQITLPQLAISWILHKQGSLGLRVIPIMGVSSSQQLLENIQALDVQLSDDDVKRIEELASR